MMPKINKVDVVKHSFVNALAKGFFLPPSFRIVKKCKSSAATEEDYNFDPFPPWIWNIRSLSNETQFDGISCVSY